jgi:hypothetical protein
MSSTETKQATRLVELHRHQTYRLERPHKNRILGMLRRSLLAQLAR